MTENEKSQHKQLMVGFAKFFSKNFIITDKGKIRLADKNRFVEKIDVWRKYETVQDLSGTSEYLSKEEVIAAIETMMPSEEKKERVDLRGYIMQKLKDIKGKIFDFDMTMTQIKYKNSNSKRYTNASMADLVTYFKSIKEDDPVLHDYNVGTIEATLDNIALSMRNYTHNSLAENIDYDEDKEEFVDEFLKTIYKYFEVSQSYDKFKKAMTHWAWTVKRSVNNKKRIWPIWINFYGATRIGKTFIIRKLSKPFENFYIEAPMRVIFEDTKEVMKLTNNFIINFEELAVNDSGKIGAEGLTKDQKSMLKSIITADKLDTRIYGKQTQMKRDVTFSCISTANEHLYDVIYDETTMRRYYEFECKRKVPGTKTELAELNKILDRSIEFWQGIDENRDEGYWDPYGKTEMQMNNDQMNYYPTKTTILYWNQFYIFTKDEDVSTTDIYEQYSTWCKNGTMKAKSFPNFNQEISKRWPELIGSDGYPRFRAVSRQGAEKMGLKASDFNVSKFPEGRDNIH